MRTKPFRAAALPMLLAAPLLAACATSRLTCTAANTRNPVLLGKLDRIAPVGETPVAARESGATRPFRVNLVDFESFTFGPGSPDRTRTGTTSTQHTDVVIASHTLGVAEQNVWVERIGNWSYGLYLVFGLLRKSTIEVEARVLPSGPKVTGQGGDQP